MSATLDALSKDGLILPPDQRLTLASRLLDSVDLEPFRNMKAISALT